MEYGVVGDQKADSDRHTEYDTGASISASQKVNKIDARSLLVHSRLKLS